MLQQVGRVQVVGTRPWEVYETTEMRLVLDNNLWLDRQTVEWVAGYLNSAPAVLDGLELTTEAGGARSDTTTVSFRLMWCVARAGTCVDPLTEADFAPEATIAATE